MHGWGSGHNWRVRAAEALFLTLVLILGVLYTVQPARRAIGRTLLNDWSSVRSLIRGDRALLLAPAEWTDIDLLGLAQFGDSLVFLGCDTAITRGNVDAQVWQITLWRATRALDRDYWLSVRLIRRDDQGKGPLVILQDHELGQQVLSGQVPSSQWKTGQIVRDAWPLPAGIPDDSRTEIWIGVRDEKEGAYLLPTTSLLPVTQDGLMLICR
jgi:hypothetical protein